MPRKPRGYAPIEVVSNARENRRVMTEAEAVIWEAIRARKVTGLKFRKQHPVDWFVLDFYCVEEMLAIEIDGSIHELEEQKEYDRERTAHLADIGIRVLRFTNDEVMNHIDEVIARMVEFVEKNPKSEGRWKDG